MTIPWIYLDKKAASVQALKDYPIMLRIVDNYADDAEETRAHLTSMGGTMPQRLQGRPNPHASENQIASTLDLIDVVDRRYSHALEYMRWFQPAWDALSEEERYLLSEFFLRDGMSRAEILEGVCVKLGFEKTAVYTRRDKAIEKLALLLYGR